MKTIGIVGKDEFIMVMNKYELAKIMGFHYPDDEWTKAMRAVGAFGQYEEIRPGFQVDVGAHWNQNAEVREAYDKLCKTAETIRGIAAVFDHVVPIAMFEAKDEKLS